MSWKSCMKLGLAVGLGIGPWAIATPPTMAQPAPAEMVASACVAKAMAADDTTAAISALSRAKNLARQAAEATNGGLGVYRAEAAMHRTISEAPCAVGDDGSWVFTVRGGAPGFVTPTQETVVSVNGPAIAILYNGPVRLSN